MLSNMLSPLAVTLLLPGVFAGLATHTVEKCYTDMGTKSVQHVPTSHKTITKHPQAITTIVTVHPVKTVTPPPQTRKKTSYSTRTTTVTDAAVTDVFSTTSTDYTTQTSTDYDTITSTSYTTTMVTTSSTTTVPAPSGFQPIQDTWQSSTFPKKRSLDHPHAGHPRSKKSSLKAGIHQQYPQDVKCTKTVDIQRITTSTKKGSTQTTTLPPRHVTKKVVSTIVSTSTVVPPDVTVTSSFSTTSTLTSTTTLTQTTTTVSTVTDTVVIPTPLVYAACVANNFMGPFVSGGQPQYIDNAWNNGVGNPQTFVTYGAASATDCCATCMNYVSCETFLYAQGECVLFYHTGALCTSQAYQGDIFTYNTNPASGPNFVAGNGKCGYFYGQVG